MSSVATARPGAMNLSALMDVAWPATVSTCRQWPSTSGCPGFPPHNSGTPPWRCIVVASATTPLRISCTWTWGASDAGSWAADLRVGITFSQGRRQFGIVSVNVIGEMDLTVFVGKRRPVNDEDRDGLRQTNCDIVLSVLLPLLHVFNCPA